jgi:SSS family solute:Na+ symporter
MPGLPFMNRWVVVFVIIALIIVIISLLESSEDDPKGIQIDRKLFHTGNAFNMGAIGILTVLAVLYTIFW